MLRGFQRSTLWYVYQELAKRVRSRISLDEVPWLGCLLGLQEDHTTIVFEEAGPEVYHAATLLESFHWTTVGRVWRGRRSVRLGRRRALPQGLERVPERPRKRSGGPSVQNPAPPLTVASQSVRLPPAADSWQDAHKPSLVGRVAQVGAECRGATLVQWP